jgi:ATP-dependent protease ClpP protease subunit
VSSIPYLVAKDENTVQVFVDDEIGFWGVTAQDVISQIQNSGKKNIEVRINSTGGSVTDALSIYNFLKDYKGIVTTKVDGLAASAATIIAQSGNKGRRYTAESAIWMVHEASMGVGGKKAEIEEALKTLDVANEALKSIYRANGVSEDVLLDMFDGGDHWFNASEAIEKGFADKTFNATSKAQARAYAIAAKADTIPQELLSKIQNKNHNMKKKFLQDAAALLNKLVSGEGSFSIENAKKEIEDLKARYETEVSETEKTINDLNAKVEGFETVKTEAIEAAVKPLNEANDALSDQVKALETETANLKASIADGKGNGGDPDKKPEDKKPLNQGQSILKNILSSVTESERKLYSSNNK